MFTHAIKLFTLNKFDIKVDPSWLIIAALVTWSLSRDFFPDALPGQAQITYLTMAVIAMMGLFVSLLLHELAHSVVARHLGVPINGITLFLFGGVAEMDAEPTAAKDELLIAVAGPLMSLCLAIGFWALSLMAGAGNLVATIPEVLSYLALINLILALFNMVPAFPLDGGRVLRAYLWHRTGNMLEATKTASRSGTFFAYFLMALGLMALFHGALAAGLWQLMIGAFVLIAARASYTSQLAQVAFDDKTVGSLMVRHPVTVGPDITLDYLINQIMLGRGVSFVPVTEGSVLLGHIDRSIVAGIDRENWASTRVGDVFVGLEDGVMIGPDTGVQDLLQIVSATGQRKFLVVSGHQLEGVITLSDLTQHLRAAGAA
ncbi:Metallopeptidase, M50 family [Sulfitobacter noctilucicola]|uniref:Zinc metalloprotease n=1 Tax=Sulfitobacter noctilucicola TaxID=1342301 RepID=A0A7W6M5I0_9RHOB|nr:site-2 protease family protein [Sulfitobacter noctilucicola]KIN62683.1 Metallopeptidase, M50 family [Sulfitobacter noctilucicola]MBB4172784.1 Zn-dependent protease/CBS domain-containing protein [Sulfitobacter noctilucicola]